MSKSHSPFTKKIANGLLNGNSEICHLGIVENPLARRLPWWYELYQRIKLFPWWIKYNLGLTEESKLQDKIINLATSMNLEKKWIKKMIRHAVSEFSKKGLGSDYYGYHNIDHELEATYFTLLSANGHLLQNNNYTSFTNEDLKYLFVSALFHDYDPIKKFDRPNEESVEWFLRNDPKIIKFIENVKLDIDIVIAIIYRTAYPFQGKIAEDAINRIQKLILKDRSNMSCNDNTKIENKNDLKRLEHYQYLGWFLSVCERIAGYSLGDFEYANKLARSNAHALGWHPCIINEESIKYFDSLKKEKDMLEFVLKGAPDKLKKNFLNNVASFQNLYDEEMRIREMARKKEIVFVSKVEKIRDDQKIDKISKLDREVRTRVLDIYNNLPSPIKLGERYFISSLFHPDTILITLRIKKQEINQSKINNNNILESGKKNGTNDEIETIIGYVKGGPLEKYNLRRGTHDENKGKKNTAYMEWICIKPGYWGSTGGHILRRNFLQEAKKMGYEFVTGYVHRNVIMKRISEGEIINIVQQYDPDKLDYYRVDLKRDTNIDVMVKEEENREEEPDDFEVII